MIRPVQIAKHKHTLDRKINPERTRESPWDGCYSCVVPYTCGWSRKTLKVLPSHGPWRLQYGKDVSAGTLVAWLLKVTNLFLIGFKESNRKELMPGALNLVKNTWLACHRPSLVFYEMFMSSNCLLNICIYNRDLNRFSILVGKAPFLPWVVFNAET